MDVRKEIPFEFALLKSSVRYLTREANQIFEHSYRSLPVHSAIPFNKYIALHALNYCDSRVNETYRVHPCKDTPPFILNIETHREDQNSLADRAFKLWPLGVLLASFTLAVVYESVLK